MRFFFVRNSKMLILRQPVTHCLGSGTTVGSVFWPSLWALPGDVPVLGGYISRMPGLRMSLVLNSCGQWVLVAHASEKKQSAN